MQIMPATGRRYARKLGMQAVLAPTRLTEPEINVRIGTPIFADSIRKFGGRHLGAGRPTTPATAASRAG